MSGSGCSGDDQVMEVSDVDYIMASGTYHKKRQEVSTKTERERSRVPDIIRYGGPFQIFLLPHFNDSIVRPISN